MSDFFEISDLIIDHNNQYIIANKLAGMPCVPDKSEDKNLKNLLESYTKHDLYPITRIDRPVSGLIIFGKNQNAAKLLTEQIQEHKIRKSYLAIVEGQVADEEGTLTDHLSKSGGNKAIVVEAKDKNAKEAKLTYSVLKRLDNYTILEVKLITGRFHQIRCQLAHHGYPIKGDVKYGARRKNKDRSIHLHAKHVGLFHPVTNKLMQYDQAPNKGDSLWKLV